MNLFGSSRTDLGPSSRLVQAALEAADLATDLLEGTLRPRQGQLKGFRDYVTELDRVVERKVREHFAHVTPEIRFLGEEDGGDNPAQGLCWVVDPIDGTVNFMRQIPLCGVSIALLKDGVAQIGIIDFPFLRERYVAVHGLGAELNGATINTSSVERLEEAVIGMGDSVGTPSDSRVQLAHELMRQFAGRALRIRILGSAAAQLAWLAAGRLDISLTLSNKPWDIQAGVLLVKEAGGCVFDSTGSGHSLSARHTLATNAFLKTVTLTIIQKAIESGSD